MKKHSIQLLIVFSVIYYFLDALLGSIAHENLGFLDMLILAVPFQELFTRLLAITFMVILGLIINNHIVAQKKSKEKKEVKDKLSANPNLMVNVSNHIKTPLNAIQGFIEMLDDTNISENSRKLYINHIRTSSKFLLELINNVTDITLIESDSLYLANTECKLNELLSDIQVKYERQVKEKVEKDENSILLRLKTNVKDKNFSIITDEKRLSQVLENLLENAIGFTDEGVIEFGYLAIDENEIEFFVRDTGSGFMPQRLDMLFAKEGSLEDRKMAPFDLASLRVKIAIKLVALLGGDLTAVSSNEKGSEFRFTLPLKVHFVNESEKFHPSLEDYDIEEKTENVQQQQWTGKTVLIAEDVESNFIYLSEILKETGINILWAENGKVACEMALKNPNIDLILMDILMPEMDGYEATVIIKKELPNVPIIAQTAYHLEEGDYKDARMYFSKVLIKPIWSYDLMHAIEDTLKDK